jgi:hypothetical protein
VTAIAGNYDHLLRIQSLLGLLTLLFIGSAIQVAATMLIQIIIVGTGVIVTLTLGLFCESFLAKSVTVTREVPQNILAGQNGGGGKQLGTLERLLFFSSFRPEAYVVIAGWLAFKVAAKWASWQHIAKLTDVDTKLEDRIRLSSHLLGRFLNGTLYNALCAIAGVVLVKFIHDPITNNLSDPSLQWLVSTLSLTVIVVVIGLVGWALFTSSSSIAENPNQKP